MQQKRSRKQRVTYRPELVMKFMRTALAEPKILQKDLARALDVTDRTVRNWKKKKRPEDFKKTGRPPHSEEAHRRAFFKVGREYLRQGRCGSQTIIVVMNGAVATRLIRRYVALFKSCEERHKRRRVLPRRVSVEVLTKNAIWVQDSAQIARDHSGKKVESQIVKDRGSLKTIGVSTGAPATGEDAVELLENLKNVRGLPLVLGTDNGSPFVCEKMAEFLQREKVIHLKSLPHTPQHNGSAEQTNGEIKRCGKLGKGVRASPIEAHARAITSASLLNNNRIRPSKGLKTAAELDEEMVSGYQKINRALFYDECSSKLEEVRMRGLGSREVRMQEREVIYGMLEKYKLVRRTWGAGQAATKPEIFL